MDPYKILGVSYDATDEEIKKAYRLLSRRYHPDANVGNPNQAAYEEKFKEVQQAYKTIMDQRSGKTQQTSYQNGYSDPFGFYGFGANRNHGYQYEQSRDDTYLNSAAQYLQNGYYREALNVLDQISSDSRRGVWYYYSAYANYKIGNNGIAVEHAKIACEFEPNNYEYRKLLSAMTGSGQRYQQRSGSYGYNPQMTSSSPCGDFCCTAAVLSLCMGGGVPIICCI